MAYTTIPYLKLIKKSIQHAVLCQHATCVGMQDLYISALTNVDEALRILDLPTIAQRGVVGTDSETAAPVSYKQYFIQSIHSTPPIQFTCQALHQHPCVQSPAAFPVEAVE